ncbi:MAG: hypothetical protein E6G94_09975 [Alphaproteobacteria bacterium]|nr:MAG: hypothetical protein E6G94_09975 [Alphaproteobacteria bacterium]
MSNSRRIVLAAALGSSILGAAPAYAQAQDTVGPPAPVAERPRPTPAPAPAPARAAPRDETPAPAPAPVTLPPADVDVAPPPVVEQRPTTPVPAPALPPQSTGPLLGPDPVLIQPDAPEPSEFPWRYVLGGAGGLALLALGFFVLRSRRRAVEERVAEPIYLSSRDEAPEPFVPPVAVPEAAPEPEPRPWLELEFKPGKIAATDERASLDYELAVKNMGGAPARNVRIEARMINAGRQQDQEINAFFQAPGEKAVRAPRPLPPGDAVVYRDTVGLPKTEVREVEIQGRRLFIPLVAFNVIYDFGDGQTGQTSMSYLVGREAEPPSEKMAAFRLDLGPRIWRSVGFRPNPLALSV